MKCELAALRPPESEAEIEAFDWKAFAPAIANAKNKFFLIIDAASGLSGKVVTWTAFIHGEVDGILFAEHVTVEEGGLVKGRVFCRAMTVMGRVEADVICDTLHVRGQGILSGAVRHKSVKIEGDGQVTGSFARRGRGEPDGPKAVAGGR